MAPRLDARKNSVQGSLPGRAQGIAIQVPLLFLGDGDLLPKAPCRVNLSRTAYLEIMRGWPPKSIMGGNPDTAPAGRRSMVSLYSYSMLSAHFRFERFAHMYMRSCVTPPASTLHFDRLFFAITSAGNPQQGLPVTEMRFLLPCWIPPSPFGLSLPDNQIEKTARR